MLFLMGPPTETPGYEIISLFPPRWLRQKVGDCFICRVEILYQILRGIKHRLWQGIREALLKLHGLPAILHHKNPV
jgi:hypothetical protein